MKKTIFLIISILLININSLPSIVIDTDNLTQIAAELEKADQNTLVVFDVDNTLIIQEDHIFRPNGSKYFKQIMAEKEGLISEEKKNLYYSIVVQKSKFTLIDPKIVDLIHNLQQKNIKTIALTAIKTGKIGILVPKLEDWRINQLNELNINFSQAFPNFPFIEFPEIGTNNNTPVFKSGILTSSKHPKGDVLEAFLKKIQWTPKKVIFIDDNEKYMASVESAMEKMNIPFVGFLYSGAEKLPCNLDKELAQFQVEYLIENLEWLNDSEAKEKMNSLINQ